MSTVMTGAVRREVLRPEPVSTPSISMVASHVSPQTVSPSSNPLYLAHGTTSAWMPVPEAAPPVAPWSKRRLNEALADLGPVRPASEPGIDPVDEPSVASPPAENATVADRPPPQDAAELRTAPVRPLPPPPRPSRPPEAHCPPIDGAEIAAGPSLSPEEIVARLASTAPPLPAMPNVVSMAVPPPIELEVEHLSWATLNASDGPRGTLGEVALRVDPDTDERPPIIIERAIAAREQETAADLRRPHASSIGLPSPWPPLAVGFALSLCAGGALFLLLTWQ